MLLHMSIVACPCISLLLVCSFLAFLFTNKHLAYVRKPFAKKKIQPPHPHRQEVTADPDHGIISITFYVLFSFVFVTQCFTLSNSSLQLSKHMVTQQVKQNGHRSISVCPIHVPSYIYHPSNLGLKHWHIMACIYIGFKRNKYYYHQST